jgi:hypothetical protein
MGTNVAGTWQETAKILQDCSTKQPGRAAARMAVCSVQNLLNKLLELPSQPKAVWKKLVQQLKVRVTGCVVHRCVGSGAGCCLGCVCALSMFLPQHKE